MEKVGLIQCYTGAGKGKSTSALGLAFRALGRGWKVLIVQLIKGDKMTNNSYGELIAGRKFEDSLKIIQSHNEFKIVLDFNKTDEDERLVNEAWDKLLKETQENNYDLIILDEILGTLCMGLITQKKFFDYVDYIKKNKPSTELVLTGRIWKEPIYDKIKNISDYMTDLRMVKHPFEKHCPICKRSFEYRSQFCPNCGHPLVTIKARLGIEL
jgi:cob(I)alamin adenosyltransferase